MPKVASTSTAARAQNALRPPRQHNNPRTLFPHAPAVIDRPAYLHGDQSEKGAGDQ